MSAAEERGTAELAARLAALTPDQRARLEERLRARRVPAAPAAIPPRPPGAAVPLSYGQRRLWILQQWEADLAAYNMSFGFGLEGELDADALARSLTEIARRHEVLRTRFQSTAGEALQVVLPPQPVRLARVDLSRRPAAEAEREAARLAAVADVTPFDLAQDPPWRALLIQLTPRRHRLLLTLHHIISDAWSMGILRHELSTLYAAFAASQPASLPELPIQYADYACWQRSEAQVRALEPQLTYWANQLRDLPDLEWPCDYPRPPALSFRGASENLRLDTSATQALHALARTENATLFMVTLAAMQLLLARWSGQDEVVVGSPVAGRSRSELEGLLGFFINMLVLRATTAGNPLFLDFLGQVRETALAALAHQDLPFDRLVEILRPRRDPGRSPLFDVAFVLQNAPATALSLPGLTLQEVEHFTSRTRHDLEVHLYDRGGCLDGCFVYNRDLFHPTTMQRLARAYETLLGAIALDPRRRLSDLPLLADAERCEVLALGRPPAPPFPAEVGIHEIFARQAAATPDAIALEAGDARMTYAELNRRADALAARLRACGVECGSPVGVCAERSPAMVVAWLAALKAGGAYLPLDVAFPPERLAAMRRDAGARAVLVQQQHRALISGDVPELPCLVLEDDALYADASPAAAQPAAGGDTPAYVVFTSGSTGRPKGVAVPHRAVNRLVLHTNYVQLGPTDVVAQMSSCTFDAATFEVWGALLNGARLAFIEPDLVLSPTQLGAELRRRGVTTLFVSTALFHTLVRHEPTVFAGVRQVLFGGEECDPRTVQSVLAGGGAPERLLHVYGPTETTTFATWHPVAPDPDAQRRVPIGRPIANTTVYVLDDHLALLPAGAAGEICIGGPGVALGYLGDAERTAQRFVPDPFTPGGRLYRSGDRGRWNADGNLEFLGRADQQVKIRGYRVEPGEIESALRTHPGVRDAAVCTVPGPAGDRCLAAYIVARDGALSAAELSAWLRRRLPPYMLPAAYVLLPALPLSAHGKLDRRALPPPVFDTPAMARDTGAPSDASAARLLAVWREVLGLPGLGPDDNFFDFGGHSLLGVNLMAQIRTEFGVHLPLRALFDAPTVTAMAAQLAPGGRTAARALPPRLIRLQPGRPEHPALFIVPGGQGGEKEFTVYGRMIRPLGPDWPVYGLLAQTWNRKQAPRTMAALTDELIGTLRSAQPHGPYALVGECLGGLAAHALAARLRAEGETVRAVVLMDTTAPDPDRRVARLWRLRWQTLLAALKLVQTPFPDPQARHRRLWHNVARRGWRHVRRARFPARLGVAAVEAARLVRFGCGTWTPVIFHRYFQQDYPSILLSYRGQPYPGTLDLVVSADYNQPAAIDPWRRWADGGLRVHAIPGNHYTYVRDEADTLGRLLARLLTDPAAAPP